MMDLDRFKEINDTLGHHFGDDLLKEIGHRPLLALLPPTARHLARLGGDEFAVTFFVKGGRRRRPTWAPRGGRITTALQTPFVLDEGVLQIEVASVEGIALCPTPTPATPRP